MSDAVGKKKPVLQSSLVYQKLALDDLGAPIFLGSFNQLEGPLPMTVPFIVSNSYTNGLGMHRHSTLITDPDEERFAQSDEIDFFLRDAVSGHRIDDRFVVTFKKAGRYRVAVMLDSEPVIQYYLIVRDRPRPTVEPSA